MRSLFILALFLLLAFHHGEAAVTCNNVVSDLYPCLSYVMQGGKVPPANCCSGVRTLNSQAQTSVDRRSVCRCIKNAIGGASYSSSNLNNALSLPAKCGVNLPFRISPSTNCDSIN
ncbi:Non-specific lipid-transfer protein 6 [Raphanus sativus]|uniref:Non-specific lipid-transfer protein n=1 Tax=Raphanus sativus TaxID=3726 RepID=A0A6J0P3U7_RAPSA|nr:non-specific lipid-transfer protein 6-like [Raphanus sativus]KAJ4898278.1 Non-specific lipid-transfer protein 6 [Raphanus sativus]